MNRNKVIYEKLSLEVIKDAYLNKRKKQIKYEGYTISTINPIYELLIKSNFKCVKCDKTASYCNLEFNKRFGYHYNAYTQDGELFTKDHIYPVSKGGLDKLKNYQLLCYGCNQKKKDNSPITLVTALREGYATKQSVEYAVRHGKPKALKGV